MLRIQLKETMSHAFWRKSESASYSRYRALRHFWLCWKHHTRILYTVPVSIVHYIEFFVVYSIAGCM